MAQKVNVVPAYGRSYTNITAARRDWEKDLDFRIVGGPYVNRQDAETYGLEAYFEEEKL